jgi:hypothetical protein
MRIGDRVGEYEVLEALGAGGMGEVYKVRHIVSDRIEAMKVLLPALGSDTELLSRFQREIKVQAALDHPNIARLYAAQIVGRDPIMVMEYVEGTSLEKSLRNGPLQFFDSVNRAMQVLDALGYAHSHGVVHRDIKPANIMLTTAGTMKLMDFGIARMKADDRLTQTGMAVGSLPYMSPEQIRGSEPDPRSDIYSLGVCLYEMITGFRPFRGDSEFSLMAAHLQQMPRPPLEITSGIPVQLNDVILKALAKDPTERFQTAGQFRSALALVPTTASQRPLDANAELGFGAVRSLAATLPSGNNGGHKTPGARGIYMALGAFAAVVVLFAAVAEGPTLLHTGASRAANRRSETITGARRAPPVVVLPSGQPPAGLVSGTGSSGAVPETSIPAVSAIGSDHHAAPRAVAQQRKEGLGTSPEQDKLLRPQRGGAPTPKTAGLTIPDDLRDRLANLQARFAAYAATLETVTNKLKSQGLGLRPELSEALNIARIKLGAAEAEARVGAYSDARKSLGAAEMAIDTIARAYGR